jgi:hypothetical protein
MYGAPQAIAETYHNGHCTKGGRKHHIKVQNSIDEVK